MMVDTLLEGLAAGLPKLPGARCAGRHELYDATIEAPRPGRAGSAELAAAREAALRLCASCQALEPCAAWLESLPKAHRPLGVVAGIVNTGRPNRRCSTRKESA